MPTSLDPSIFVPAITMVIALIIDHICGEPPLSLHPVAAIGKWLHWSGRWAATSASHARAFIRGMLAWLGGASLCGLSAFVCQWVLAQLPFWATAILLGLLLKPLLAWAMLRNEVMAVESTLSHDLDQARQQLSRLVSRDTQTLNATEIRESAIETLAENLNDSVIAPIFWFCLAGLPGAAIYRFANTADAMWGYRDHREWSGKWAARADDVLSWIPARITALLMLPQHLPQLRRLAQKTPSPNGGWPMGAMALRLGIRLTKPGVYILNAEGRAPQTNDIFHATRIAAQTVFLAAFLGLITTLAFNILPVL